MQDRQLWRQQDAGSDPGTFAALFRDLPEEPAELRRVVRVMQRSIGAASTQRPPLVATDRPIPYLVMSEAHE